jgi:WXG100 family type VII secretion target
MHFSGTSTIQLDHARFAAGSDTLAARVGDMADRRREVGDAVDALLRGWRGDGADAFRHLWERWRDGADGVIVDLRSSVEALDLARADLSRADDSASAHSGRLRERLA